MHFDYFGPAMLTIFMAMIGGWVDPMSFAFDVAGLASGVQGCVTSLAAAALAAGSTKVVEAWGAAGMLAYLTVIVGAAQLVFWASVGCHRKPGG